MRRRFSSHPKKHARNENEYNIWFVDSGTGGLIFLYDAYDLLNAELKKLEARYDIKFNLVHFAEASSKYTIPDDGLTDKKVHRFTRNVIAHALENNANICVVACNTASTAIDSEMLNSLEKRYPGKTVLPIIDESAQHLYEAADSMPGKRTIGILATPITINSEQYQQSLNAIHDGLNSDEELLLVVHAAHGLSERIDEGATVSDLMPEIRLAVSDMIDQANGNPIQAVGLFCTHYVLLSEGICQAFQEQGYGDITLISQGNIFVEKLVQQVEKDIAVGLKNGTIKRRAEGNINITSLVTGSNLNKVQQAAHSSDPALAAQTAFKRERPRRRGMPRVQPRITTQIIQGILDRGPQRLPHITDKKIER
jgi:glutamate racemase